MRSAGRGRFTAFSAGSHPTGKIHPLVLELLSERGIDSSGLRSKSWDEFSGPGAPNPHFIFTLCDNAAVEPCPAWPGKARTAHWGIDDPDAVSGTDEEKRNAFQKAFSELQQRIDAFLASAASD